jgi:hypothetical protein
VRNFFREHWKIAAFFAAGAFILSLITGLVARNPFGVVFFRALLLAVVFAALGAGLRYVVKKYLPELLPQSAETASGSNEAPSRGTKVDIVLPEERPLGQSMYGEGARGAERPESEAEGMEALEPERAEMDAPETEAEAAALGELASELAEELPAEEGQEAGEISGDENGAVGAAGDAGGAALQGDASDAQGDTDLDSLPDIANLETPDEPEAGGRAARSAARRGAGTPADALRGAVGGQDPATIARAIRTVLRRDEKG